MSQARRAARPRARAEGSHPSAASARAAEPAHAPAAAAPAWAAAHTPAPFALAGVQRSARVGPADDAYEREAEMVGRRVASGGSIQPERISRLPSGEPPVAPERVVTAAEGKKKDRREDPASAPVQMAPATPEKKPEEKPKPPPVQKAIATPGKKPEEKPKPSPVQKAAATPEKKPEEKPKPSPVQKAAATPEKKPEEKPKPSPVQKAAATPEKKPEEKPKPPPVQKAAATPEKKPEEKPKPPPVQKAPATPEKKPEEKPKPPPVQKAVATPEKKPEEKPKPPPVQKAAATPEKKPEEKPKRPVQKAPATPEKKPEEKPKPPPVQRAAAGGVTEGMDETARRAIAGKGAGEPLHPSTRGVLESRMGVDLGDVRIHHDTAARAAARDLDARAFTHGRDIWLGSGESQGDVGLMAHEATHVVQQAGGVRPLRVQRQGTPSAPTPAAAGAAGGEEYRLPLPLPPVKSRHRALYEAWASSSRLKRPRGYDRGKPRQESRWLAGVDVTNQTLPNPHPTATSTGEQKFRLSSGREITADFEQFEEWRKIPAWDRQGNPRRFHVDHMIELQVADQGAAGPANEVGSMELFDERANTSSGGALKNEIRRRLATHLAQRNRPHGTADIDRELRNKDIVFDTIAPGTIGNVPEGASAYWTKAEIESGAQFHGVQAAPAAGTTGSATSFALMSPGGGLVLRQYPHPEGPGTITPANAAARKAVAGLDISQITINADYAGQAAGANIGTLTAAWDLPAGVVPRGNPSGLTLQRTAGQNAGCVGPLPPLTADLTGMSPMQFDQVRIRNGMLFATGNLRSTIPLFGNRPIQVRLVGCDLELAVVFTAGQLNLPVPGVTIDDASVAVFFGTRGLGVEGGLDLSVRGLGRGSLLVTLSTGSGFEARGGFSFDSELFDQAEISIWYRNGRFGGSGTLAITTPNKVRGIRSASITAEYNEGRFTAAGTVSPSLPGVREASLNVTYSEAEGLVISGRLQLAEIPGIASGTVDVTLTKTDRWKVAATGTAVPSLPGIASTLTISYDDGAFDIRGTAEYNRGMLSGSIAIGATNRPIGPDGRPAGPPPEGPGATLVLYGGGTVRLRLAPWLQATAGIRLLPNGEIEVTGEIALPSALDLFPVKPFNRNLLTVGIDIPIVGVSVLGQRIGIFANISGGLDLIAGIGPGQLRDVRLAVTYNPAHEDQTHVVGSAALHIPAQAGLRLFVRGSLGVGIPIVSAQAGIELGGSLGIEGALDAGVQVDWTPTTGLDVRAQAEIFAEPKFKFDVTGFVLVEADLLFSTLELYSKRWRLASFEYGSGLRLGMRLPIHYAEGQTFDVSMDDVQFEYPRIEPMALLQGLVERIA